MSFGNPVPPGENEGVVRRREIDAELKHHEELREVREHTHEEREAARVEGAGGIRTALRKFLRR